MKHLQDPRKYPIIVINNAEMLYTPIFVIVLCFLLLGIWKAMRMLVLNRHPTLKEDESVSELFSEY